MPTKSVLIADDDPSLVTALMIRCELLGLEVRDACDAMSALTAIHTDPPGLIILDVNMPAGNGLSVCEMLATDKKLDPIPIVVLTGRSDAETIARCENLGAHYVSKGADVWDRLEPLVCRLLDIQPGRKDNAGAGPTMGNAPAAVEESSHTEPSAVAAGPHAQTAAESSDEADWPRVLVIDDDAAVSKALQLKLRPHRVAVIDAQSGMQGYWMALKYQPGAIIADYTMPDGAGDYLLTRLKDHPLTRDIPVIILTGRSVDGQKDCALERQLYNLGAVNFFVKPVEFERLLGELGRHINIHNFRPWPYMPSHRDDEQHADYCYNDFLRRSWGDVQPATRISQRAPAASA